MIVIDTVQEGEGIRPTIDTKTTRNLKRRLIIVHRQAHLHHPDAAITHSQTEAKSQKVMEAIDTYLHLRHQHVAKMINGKCCSSHRMCKTFHFYLF